MVNNGGPAFPRPDWNGSWVGPDSYSGMSLRAYIATDALKTAAQFVSFTMTEPSYFEGYDHRCWDPNDKADMAELDAANKERDEFHQQSIDYAASYPARLSAYAVAIADALIAELEK